MKNWLMGCVLLAAACPARAEVADAPAPLPETAAAAPEAAGAPIEPPSAVSGEVRSPASLATCCTVPAGARVELEIVEVVNSSRHKRGDRFALRLQAPLKIGDTIVMPAGTPGVGEVVHAAAARGGGAPGELLLAGRYLEFDGRQWPLRGMKVSTTGRDSYGAAMATAVAVGVFAMFVRGHEIEVPAGTPVEARLAQPVQLPPVALASANATPAVAASAPDATADAPPLPDNDSVSPTTPADPADAVGPTRSTLQE